MGIEVKGGRERIKLLLDEHIWLGLAGTLRPEGYDVLHVCEANLSGASDDVVLQYATENGRALLTFNAKDFVELNRQWSKLKRKHAGIIISSQIKPAELLRRTRKLLGTKSPDDLSANIDFLNDYK